MKKPTKMTRTNLNRMHKAAKALELKVANTWFSEVFQHHNIVVGYVAYNNHFVYKVKANLIGALLGFKPKAKHYRVVAARVDRFILRHFKTPHQASNHSTDQKQTSN